MLRRAAGLIALETPPRTRQAACWLDVGRFVCRSVNKELEQVSGACRALSESWSNRHGGSNGDLGLLQEGGRV